MDLVDSINAIAATQPVTWVLLYVLYREMRKSNDCPHCGSGPKKNGAQNDRQTKS